MIVAGFIFMVMTWMLSVVRWWILVAWFVPLTLVAQVNLFPLEAVRLEGQVDRSLLVRERAYEYVRQGMFELWQEQLVGESGSFLSGGMFVDFASDLALVQEFYSFLPRDFAAEVRAREEGTLAPGDELFLELPRGHHVFYYSTLIPLLLEFGERGVSPCFVASGDGVVVVNESGEVVPSSVVFGDEGVATVGHRAFDFRGDLYAAGVGDFLMNHPSVALSGLRRDGLSVACPVRGDWDVDVLNSDWDRGLAVVGEELMDDWGTLLGDLDRAQSRGEILMGRSLLVDWGGFSSSAALVSSFVWEDLNGWDLSGLAPGLVGRLDKLQLFHYEVVVPSVGHALQGYSELGVARGDWMEMAAVLRGMVLLDQSGLVVPFDGGLAVDFVWYRGGDFEALLENFILMHPVVE